MSELLNLRIVTSTGLVISETQPITREEWAALRAQEATIAADATGETNILELQACGDSLFAPRPVIDTLTLAAPTHEGTYRAFDGEWQALVPDGVKAGDRALLTSKAGVSTLVVLTHGLHLTTGGGKVIHSFAPLTGGGDYRTRQGRRDDAARDRQEAREAGRARACARLIAEEDEAVQG